jgi:hypothetical protein
MNDKKLWFKAKRYGWGWYPSSFEGWMVMVVYVVIFVAIFKNINTQPQIISGIVLPIFILTGALIAICYWKGETPRWRWGKD